MKLIDDIDTLFKRWSVWVQGTVVALGVYFLTLPEKLQDAVPHSVLVAVAVVGGIATIGAQMVKQSNLTKPQ